MARKIRNKPAIAVSGARKVHRDASLVIKLRVLEQFSV